MDANSNMSDGGSWTDDWQKPLIFGLITIHTIYVIYKIWE